MDQAAYDPNEREVVNYVPDEVCVVVAADKVADGAAFYEHVRTRLNARLVELLRQVDREREPNNPLASDLSPQRLVARFGQDAAPLQPLVRPGVQPGRLRRRALAPWLNLRRESAGASTWQLYYQLGRDRVSLDPGKLDERLDHLACIRELVLLFNVRLVGLPIDRFRRQAWSIRVTSPNWLLAAAPFSCGSPAGLPLPAAPEDADHSFAFHDDDLEDALEAAQRGRVIVAVLDTCPSQDDFDAAQAAFPNNLLLQQVHAAVPMNDPPLVPPDYFSHLAGCQPRWQWDMGPLHPDAFPMPDHGLFATGVIHSIVPRGTRVHLIRVLNDVGIGDVLAISHALAALPRALLGADQPGPRKPRLVVNLSLGAEIPIPARLLDRWLPATARDTDQLAARMPELCALLDRVHGNLADVLGWLGERGVLVVAAAGNDALRPDVAGGQPPPPRYPARYDDVLGVAAVRRDLHGAALYSNRGDLVPQAGSGHVATFGGDVVPAANPQTPATTSRDDSVIGIFSGPLPDGSANTTGWVKWSGTSFSTPIVAGIAARLWGTDRTRTPLDVAHDVRSFARPMHAGIDPDSPLEVPVLHVTQA